MQINIPDTAYKLKFGKPMTVAEFDVFCQHNSEIVTELTPNGIVIIGYPVIASVGERQAILCAQLTLFTRAYSGYSLSGQTGYLLPDRSVRMASMGYVNETDFDIAVKSRYQCFNSVVPNFVVEIVSPADQEDTLKARMRDVWIANGVQLAWLIDVDNDKLWIYRIDGTVDLVTPLNQTITGEDVLPGFTFDLSLLS